MKLLATVFLLCLCCTPSYAGTLSPASHQEIQRLLNGLGNSGCQFNRNASWHTAKEAQVHLQKKFQYLLDKGAIASTEQFIALAASKSSLSGKPYLVQCPGMPPKASSAWLHEQLQQLLETAR